MTTALELAGAVLAGYVALTVALLIAKPADGVLRESLRLLPDVVRLLAKVATDRATPRGAKIRLGLLAAYLASPIDIIPDFVPVIGYADDAIVTAWVLRSVARRVGLEQLRGHWAGTPDGFDTLCRVTGLHDGRDLARPL